MAFCPPRKPASFLSAQPCFGPSRRAAIKIRSFMTQSLVTYREFPVKRRAGCLGSEHTGNRGAAAAPIWCLPRQNQLPKWTHYENYKPAKGSSKNWSSHAGDPRRRTETPRRKCRRGNQYLPELDFHIFVHARNERMGGRKKSGVHLYALRESDANCSRRKNRRARRRGRCGSHFEWNGRHFFRAPRSFAARR